MSLCTYCNDDDDDIISTTWSNLNSFTWLVSIAYTFILDACCAAYNPSESIIWCLNCVLYLVRSINYRVLLCLLVSKIDAKISRLQMVNEICVLNNYKKETILGVFHACFCGCKFKKFGRSNQRCFGLKLSTTCCNEVIIGFWINLFFEIIWYIAYAKNMI